MAETGEWRLPPLREGRPADAALLEKRECAAAAFSGGAPPARETIGGVACLRFAPARRLPSATILYLHGGGYRMGSPIAYSALARRIAEIAQAEVVAPAYRLAPEHPFPAALHDAAAVYRALAARDVPVIAGDSAGGGLAAALALAAADAGQPAAGLVLISPMLDLRATDPSYDSHAASDTLFSRQAVAECADIYLQGHAADDPLVSPLHADPARLPPALILVGGDEVLIGESLALTRRLALANRRVTLHVAPAMGHVWPLLAPQTEAAAAAIGAIAAFVAGLSGKAPAVPRSRKAGAAI